VINHSSLFYSVSACWPGIGPHNSIQRFARSSPFTALLRTGDALLNLDSPVLKFDLPPVKIQVVLSSRSDLIVTRVLAEVVMGDRFFCPPATFPHQICAQYPALPAFIPASGIHSFIPSAIHSFGHSTMHSFISE
jgi:hypothetical protein